MHAYISPPIRSILKKCALSHLQILVIFCILSGAVNANIFGDILDTIGGWWDAYGEHTCANMKFLRSENYTAEYNPQVYGGFFFGLFSCDKYDDATETPATTTPDYDNWYFESWKKLGFTIRQTVEKIVYKLRRM
ncbi:hypothetical protein GCK72_003328 [Caenorhabditis remanei]|uniref:Uncharacterized protein n=1 Tax=Caenorhabditis remanei TaxID=31234 RepID=A0A6A5HW71_CAERE|nr:hypothetical protein GCK72_003328 [Caenorhabditis remanei]KAF1771501.1 hypothetical protein GCK72_003328 [Caenorhabditis remanei]